MNNGLYVLVVKSLVRRGRENEPIYNAWIGGNSRVVTSPQYYVAEYQNCDDRKKMIGQIILDNEVRASRGIIIFNKKTRQSNCKCTPDENNFCTCGGK